GFRIFGKEDHFMKPLIRCSLCLLALPLLPGCFKPVNVKQTLTLAPGEFRAIIIAPPKSDQTINVVARSPNTPVDIYVIFGEDEDKLDKQIKSVRGFPANPEKVVRGVSDTSFEFTVPANKAFAVGADNTSASKSAEVELHVTN